MEDSFDNESKDKMNSTDILPGQNEESILQVTFG
jgi:hypothetical protein